MIVIFTERSLTKGCKLDPAHQYLPNTAGTNCIFVDDASRWEIKMECDPVPLLTETSQHGNLLQVLPQEPHRNSGIVIATKTILTALLIRPEDLCSKIPLQAMNSYLNLCITQRNSYRSSDFFDALKDYFPPVLGILLGEFCVAVHWEPVYPQYPLMEIILHFLTDESKKALCTHLRTTTKKKGGGTVLMSHVQSKRERELIQC